MTTAEDYRRNTLSGGHKFKESNAVHNKHFLVSDLNLNVTFKMYGVLYFNNIFKNDFNIYCLN